MVSAGQRGTKEQQCNSVYSVHCLCTGKFFISWFSGRRANDLQQQLRAPKTTHWLFLWPHFVITLSQRAMWLLLAACYIQACGCSILFLFLFFSFSLFLFLSFQCDLSNEQCPPLQRGPFFLFVQLHLSFQLALLHFFIIQTHKHTHTEPGKHSQHIRHPVHAVNWDFKFTSSLHTGSCAL